MFTPGDGQLLIPVTFPEHLIPVRSAPPVMDSPEILRATIESNMTPVHGFNDEYFRGELKGEFVGQG
jgi:hypothetical protein